MKYQISPTPYLLELLEERRRFFADKLLCRTDIELNFELFVEAQKNYGDDNEPKRISLMWSILDTERSITLSSNFFRHKKMFGFAYAITSSNGQITPELTTEIADDLATAFFAREGSCFYSSYAYSKQIFTHRVVEFEHKSEPTKKKVLLKILDFLHIEYKVDCDKNNLIEGVNIVVDAALTSKERAAIFTQRDYSEPKDYNLLCEQLLQLAKSMGIYAHPLR